MKEITRVGRGEREIYYSLLYNVIAVGIVERRRHGDGWWARERAMDSARSRYTRCLSEGGGAVGVCGRERSETLRPPPHLKLNPLSFRPRAPVAPSALLRPNPGAHLRSLGRALAHSLTTTLLHVRTLTDVLRVGTTYRGSRQVT